VTSELQRTHDSTEVIALRDHAQDRILVISVFFVASCGLAYELIAGALSSYLLGDSVLQFSSVIGCYLFAMGIGAQVSRYVKDDLLLTRFVDIELLIGLIGGVSASLLFLAFAWLAAPFRALLYVVVFLLGVLVGMEIPLVMRVLNRANAHFGDLIARVLTFDYLGALAVSLLFPLLLAPHLGLTRTAFLFGILNVAVALFSVYSFRERIVRAQVRALYAVALLALLCLGFFASNWLVNLGERGMFGDEVVYAVNTPYQRLVLTRWKDDLRLYINGNLQFSSRDEYRYHEALVHPVMASLPWARHVLVLGGGDGLALREILRYDNVQDVTLVDLDAAVTDLFSTAPILTALNHQSFSDPRVHLVNADAARWLEQTSGTFDAIFVDFPDPSNFALGKLYSVPVYRELLEHLSAHGLVVVQATSPFFAPHAYWSIDATLREAGFKTSPYHVYVPSFGEWGFIVGAPEIPFRAPAKYALPMRFLNGDVTREMFEFPPDMPHPVVEANHLNDQALVRYFDDDWHQVIR
jgi:spermidine synthase